MSQNNRESTNNSSVNKIKPGLSIKMPTHEPNALRVELPKNPPLKLKGI